jgi:hypothetical protein
MGIDLMRVFKGDKPKAKPELAAVVVFAHEAPETQESVRKAIEDAGLTTKTVRKADENTTVVYTQKDHDPDKTVMIRLSDQMLVTALNVEPLKGLFGALVEKNGFVPDLPMAMDLFAVAVQEAVTKSDDPQADIDSAYKSLGEYLKLMGSLPSAAFVAADAVQAFAVKAETPCDDEEKEQTEEEKAAKVKADAEKVEAEKTEKVTEPVKPAEKVVEKPAEKVVEPVAKNETAAILEAIAGLRRETKDSIKGVAAKVDAVVVEQGKQKKTLDEVVQKAETLDSKLKTTVVTPDTTEDRPAGPRHTQRKADDDPRTGNFDTAFIGRRRNKL